MAFWKSSVALLLASLLGSNAIPTDVQQVTTHGGGPLRSNWYAQQSPPWLCRDWDATGGGKTFTQPLMVREQVYYLSGNRLSRFDLQGREIGAMVFDKWAKDGTLATSKGQLTYHLGASPADDLLFVPTPGPPYGIAMIRPHTILGTVSYTDTAVWKSSLGYYVVTAPLYFPDLGAIAFGTAGKETGHIWLVSVNRDFPDYQYPPTGSAGWVSGSPVQTGSNQFVIGVKNGLRRLSIASGELISGTADHVGTSAAVLSAVVGGQPDKQGNPTVLYFSDKLGTLYKVDTTSGPELTDEWKPLPSRPHVTGFNNSGPALDDKYVYLPIRWPLPDRYSGDASGPSNRPSYGSMTAFDQNTGERAWSDLLQASGVPLDDKPSWVNVEPLIFGGGRFADQTLKPRVVLGGDAGGRVWAWDGEGNAMPFALVDDDKLPIACDKLEGIEPPATVHYSPVAALSVTPYVQKDRELGWHNDSGVAGGLVFARDRLLVGVNEQVGGSGPVGSRLVALRAGTNAWIQSLTLWQNGEERTPEKLKLGQKTTVKLTAAWHVTGVDRTLAPLKVYTGWPDQSVNLSLVQTVTPTGSLGQQPFEFELPARPDLRRGTVTAVLNPGLLMRRQPKEEGATPMPDRWRDAFVDAAVDANLRDRGEVLVGDNLVNQGVGDLLPPVAQLWLAPGNACTGQEIRYTTSYWDPEGLPRAVQQAQPFGWPPPARFDSATTVKIRYRAQNAAGMWSAWAERPLTVRDCTKPPPPPPSVAFNVGFDPAVGHRGHRINMQVNVQRKDEMADHKLTAFTVSGVTVTLADELRNLRACVSYQPCWEAPNSNVDAEGSDLEWHYSFDLPAPGTMPEDGSYAVSVAALGTYTWDHWHPDLQWEPDWVDVCNTDPVSGKETCESVDQGKFVDHGENHPHTKDWSASERVIFEVNGGHQFVHPATDHD